MSEGSLTPAGFAEDMKEAAEHFDVVRGTETTLLLDLDNPASVEQFDRVLPKVREHFSIANVEEWSSKSGNRHVRIHLEKPQPMAVRLALQAALGSDGIRELLGIKRMQNGVVEPSVLFKPRVTVPCVFEDLF